MKPVEPEKITGNLDKDVEMPKESSPARTRAPMEALAAKRPDAETAPFTTLVPKISPGLKKDAEALVQKSGGNEENGTVPIGEPCKNGGCKKVRQISNMAAVFHFQSPFALCYYVCPFAALRRQRRE